MADAVELEFISNFHSLTGTTLKERYRNVYTLLNKTRHPLELTSNKINLSSLVPTTPLEASFKVIALIHFKCAHEILEVLKSENTALINQVFKHAQWLIKEVFIDVTPEYLSTQLFPSISYNTKLKLLNSLSYYLNDVHRSEEYFDAIKEKYGYFLASKLLSSCSSDRIIKCIELYKTEITPRQLLLILKRYPNITEIILEKLDQQNAKVKIGEKYKTVFKYLATNDVPLFLKLYQKYSPDICLGSRETDFFIKHAKELTQLENTKFYKIFKTKQIGKSMGLDFEEFYFKIFPKCINQAEYDLDSNLKLLRFMPNDAEKLIMLSKTFKRIYGNNIFEYSHFIIDQIMAWMPPNERTLWMESVSRPTDITEQAWTAYYKIDKSIPLIKEKIQLSSSIKVRSGHIATLIKTCKVNKNDTALLDVLKYFNLKHRNDHSIVIQNFLSTFNECYKKHQLTIEHWSEINQCVQLFTLNNGYSYCCRDLIEKYIYNRLSRKLDVKDELEYWAKQYVGEYNICEEQPKFQKYCLIEFEALVPLGYKKDELKTGYMRYLYCVKIYNDKHPRDKLPISGKPEYVDHLKKCLETNIHDYEAQVAAVALIMHDCNKAEEDGLLELLFDQQYYHVYYFKLMNWLIKEHPLQLLKYFHFILNAASYQNFLTKLGRIFCTKYSHLQIPQKITKLCCDIIKDEETYDKIKIKTAIVMLSILMNPEEFSVLSSAYYPTELSPDFESEVQKSYYIKQQAIAASFRNLVPLSQSLDGILHFCKGDYLKFVQKSVDLACVNTAENKIVTFLNTLKNRAVSVKKHGIFMSCRVLNKSNISATLLEHMQKEKNSSIRKVLFKAAFHSFLNNSDNHLWDISKQCLETADFSDGEVFEILTSCSQVSLEYFGKYMTFSWDIIEKCTSSEKTIDDGKSCLLNLVSKTNMSTLPNEFCIKVLEQNMFKSKSLSDFQKNVQAFACKYLFYGYGSQEERLQIVFKLLKELKSKNESKISAKALALKLVHNFVKQLCDNAMDKNFTNIEVFRKFIIMWTDTVKPYDAFYEYIYLQLTSLYLDVLNNKLGIAEIGEKVAIICNLLHEENCLVTSYFSASLNEFLHHFYALEFIGESDLNQIILIENIVKDQGNSACLELAACLLPTIIPVSPIIKQKYDYIVNTIAKDPNHFVQVTLCNYLRNTITSNE